VDKVLSLVERTAVLAAFRAINEARQQLTAVHDQAKKIMNELGLDPDEQYEIRPDGSIHSVSPADNPSS